MAGAGSAVTGSRADAGDGAAGAGGAAGVGVGICVDMLRCSVLCWKNRLD